MTHSSEAECDFAGSGRAVTADNPPGLKHAVEKDGPRQPEPDALKHEGLWCEPTSSTGCEVMRSSGPHGKDGLTLRIQTPRRTQMLK